MLKEMLCSRLEVYSRMLCSLSILCEIRRWPSFDSRQKAVLQSNNKTSRDII